MNAQMPQNSHPRYFVSDFNKSAPIKSLVMLRDVLMTEKGSGATYAKLESTYGVNRYYLWNIINRPDYQPPVKVLQALGVEITATVVVVTGGEVPQGAQVINASRCECGQWYISNHPARKRCFICSPYHKRGKHG